ncbi:c-type cytochrome [Litoreibacter roseus]|uniref:Cytochrome c domain-containing protein n=1 Tax=Litoreibacter roseus TaxID=2601869 RepID=A0A6N6J9U1_9RHOB|nr:c-type cytochrome [Litoreibacter roseus]GFE63023.1 hypothetical protein KIN_00970 [Litoreibacter roseus]
MRRFVAVCLLCAAPATAQDFFTLKGHGGPIMGIAVSPDDRIATASFDNSVGLWSEGKPDWQEGHEAAVNAVLYASSELVFSAGDDFDIIRWDLVAGVQSRLEGHEGKITALAASDRVLASASWDGTIGLWPLDGGAPQFLQGHDNGVNTVAFSDDGATLYSGSVDGTIRVWDVATAGEKLVLVKHGFGVNELILNEAAGWLAYGAVDGVTRVVSVATGELLSDFTLERRPILSMAASPDGARLAVGDGEGFIMVIDTENWKILKDFRATQQGPVWALAFSRNGMNIHAGGLDDTMYSWPVATMDTHDQMSTEPRSFLENPEDLGNGERQFKRKCSICHTLTPDSARRAGPTLYGLFGRKAGTVKDYSYSSTLTGSPMIWSDETIDGLFDLGPDHYIPGTKMPMQRIVKAQDRADLIDYLKTATAEEGN